MPPATADTPYPLGATSAEHARLIRQAVIWDPFTERLFRDAGIGPGQRVLDIGSGVGDVAMLAARLVGQSGAVIGVERPSHDRHGAIARRQCRAFQREFHVQRHPRRPEHRAL